MAAERSNWGRWGTEDERGALNLLTPETVRCASKLIRSGKVYSLGTPVGEHAPTGPSRDKPRLVTHAPESSSVKGAGGAEDVLTMNLHSSSHIDSFAHSWYDGRLYNGHPAAAVTTASGAGRCSIANATSLVGRGVLLDIAGLNGVEYLEDGYAVLPKELDEAEKRQGVRVGLADILLVRTGWYSLFQRRGDEVRGSFPGLDASCRHWLAERDICAVGADNGAVEVWPPSSKPLHHDLLRDLGIYLIEYLDLEELAADHVSEFLFIAAPLKIDGGTASPVNPLAIV